MKKENLSVNKNVRVSLDAEEVKAAIIAKAGGKKAASAEVMLNADGSAVVDLVLSRAAKAE